jgi:branched-chain amino acid transport system ATP-binding protein
MSGCRLEAREISKSFGGVKAVDNVSFTAEAGSITGIVGPNGAGKTTLFNLLTGVYAADHGQLVVGAAAVPKSAWQPHKVAGLGVARTFQSARVFPNLNVFDNVLVGAEAVISRGDDPPYPPAARPMAQTANYIGRAGRGIRPKKRKSTQLAAEVTALLTALDLSERVRDAAGTLPAGSQKVVELARVLLARPRVLLLDEPASGLSETETARLADILVAVRGLGITVVIVDHNLRLVMGICDQVVVMDAGKVIAAGDPAGIQADPAVRAAYLGASG